MKVWTLLPLSFLQEVLDAGLHATPQCMECVDVMLPSLASILEPPNYSISEDAADASLRKIYKALSILSGIFSVIARASCSMCSK